MVSLEGRSSTSDFSARSHFYFVLFFLLKFAYYTGAWLIHNLPNDLIQPENAREHMVERLQIFKSYAQIN